MSGIIDQTADSICVDPARTAVEKYQRLLIYHGPVYHDMIYSVAAAKVNTGQNFNGHSRPQAQPY